MLPCEFDDIGNFNSYYGFVKKNNKWALLSRKFEVLTDYIFDENAYFHNGKASVKKDGRYFIIDSMARELKALPYDYMLPIGPQGRYTMAKIKNSYGYIDRDGNAIIPIEYEAVEQTVDHAIFPVKKNGKWGYVNEKNEVVVPFKYDLTRPIYKGFGAMQDKSFKIIGAINEQGKIIYDDGKYQDMAYADEGKYKVLKDQFWGYVDSISFKEIISPRFSSCGYFYKGIATVTYNGYANIVDLAGNLLLPQQYKSISHWGDVYFVEKDNKFGAINKNGRILLPIEYDNIQYGGDFANIQKNKLWGIVKYDFSVFIQPAYNYIRSIDATHFLGKKGDQSYIVDVFGKEKLVE